MSYSIEITPQALNDIEAAYRWIANNLGTTFVKQWYQDLAKAIASLNVFPNRCAIVHEADGFNAISVSDKSASIEFCSWLKRRR